MDAPRCPDCCEHGVPLTRDCLSCEDQVNGYLDPIDPAQPMWLCPHGLGVEPGST